MVIDSFSSKLTTFSTKINQVGENEKMISHIKQVYGAKDRRSLSLGKFGYKSVFVVAEKTRPLRRICEN